VTGRSTSTYRRPLHTKRRSGFGALWGSRDGKGPRFVHLLPNALHLTLQARCLHCSGCHFELKQLGFTAAYRALQCLLTSWNTFLSIFRAGLLQPHGSESGTSHSCDLIRRHACSDVLMHVPVRCWARCCLPFSSPPSESYRRDHEMDGTKPLPAKCGEVKGHGSQPSESKCDSLFHHVWTNHRACRNLVRCAMFIAEFGHCTRPCWHLKHCVH
jgi:hypothetical protein